MKENHVKTCTEPDCEYYANYLYKVTSSRQGNVVSKGKQLAYCFAHGVIAKRFRGRLERMWTP